MKGNEAIDFNKFIDPRQLEFWSVHAFELAKNLQTSRRSRCTWRNSSSVSDRSQRARFNTCCSWIIASRQLQRRADEMRAALQLIIVMITSPSWVFSLHFILILLQICRLHYVEFSIILLHRDAARRSARILRAVMTKLRYEFTCVCSIGWRSIHQTAAT